MTADTATTRAGEKFVRDLLTRGRPIQFIADASGWPPSKVQEMADQLAVDAATAPASVDLTASPPAASPASPPSPGPRPVRPAPSAQPAPQRPPTASGITIEALVAAAERSTSKRIQQAGRKLAATSTQVRKLLAAEREREQAAAREKAEREAAAEKVRVLEAELAAAKARLRPSRAQKQTPPQSGSPKEIRAWAAANGVECPAVGRVPKQVAEAYASAQAS